MAYRTVSYPPYFTLLYSPRYNIQYTIYNIQLKRTLLYGNSECVGWIVWNVSGDGERERRMSSKSSVASEGGWGAWPPWKK